MTDKEDHPQYQKVMFNEYPDWINYPYVTIPESRYDQCMLIGRQIASAFDSDSMDPDQEFGQRVATTVTGILGEYAFARYYGYDVETLLDSYTPYLEGDEGVDFRAYYRKSDDEITIDVKTTDYYDGNLLMPKNHKVRSEFYFLLERRDKEIGIIGFVTGNRLKNAEIRDYDCPTRFVERSTLNDPPDPIDIKPEGINKE